jgi:hypothetical protein
MSHFYLNSLPFVERKNVVIKSEENENLTKNFLFEINPTGMATSHQQNTFVPPTVKQRAEALGETDKVSIDYP